MSLDYQVAVLADTPILYYRLDQLGGGVDGESVPDLSGNGFDASLVFNGSNPPWGYLSPIETDASSREFWGYTNPVVYGFTGASHINRASDSAFEPSGDFTVEAWIRPMDNIPFAGTFGLTAKQDSGGILMLFNGAVRLGGFCFDSAGTLFTVVDNSFAVPDYIGSSFHVVVERDGNALALYINGSLRNTTTITSGLPTRSTSSPFYIHPGGSFYLNDRFDEVAYYDYALGGARALVHYEAALAILNSSATITVRVPVTLDTDSIEPVEFPFTHNWADPISRAERVITETLTYRTHFNRSEPDYQQRVGARTHGPQRMVEIAVTPTTAIGRARLQQLLWQPAGVYRLPIDTDWTVLTAQANPSDMTLDCDTTMRDFETGSYVSVWANVQDVGTYQTFRITSVSDTQLGVTPAVGAAMPVGSPIMPARLACLPDESLDFDAYTVDRETASLKFEVLATELSTRRVTAYTPVSTYLSTEVFSLDSARFEILEQSPYQMLRRQLGTGTLTGNDYYRAVDTMSPVTVPVRVLLTTRAQISEFYGWLEARQGRLTPVWVPSNENDLQLVAKLSSTSLRTIGYSTYNLHYGRRDIQLTYADGSVVNRRITASVANGNGTEDITVASVPAGTITKLSWLRRCVAPDTFELRFHRDFPSRGMIVECAFNFTELLTTP